MLITSYLSCEPLVRKVSGVSKSLSSESKSSPPMTGKGSFLKDVVDPDEPNSFSIDEPRKFGPFTASS